MHCTGLALFLKSDYWAVELPMHCTVLLLFINSHHRLFKLDSSLFMHPSDLKRILHRHFFKFQFCQISILLFLCIARTLLTLLTVNIEDLRSILLFLCVAQTLLSFSAVNIGVSGQKPPRQKLPGHKPPDKNPLDKNPPCQKPPRQNL